MNVVMTGAGHFVEVQGTAEGAAFSRAEMDALMRLAEKGIAELIRCSSRRSIGSAQATGACGIVLASNNPGKLAELQQLFAPLGVEVVRAGAAGHPARPRSRTRTFVENALAKARHAAAPAACPRWPTTPGCASKPSAARPA